MSTRQRVFLIGFVVLVLLAIPLGKSVLYTVNEREGEDSIRRSELLLGVGPEVLVLRPVKEGAVPRPVFHGQTVEQRRGPRITLTHRDEQQSPDTCIGHRHSLFVGARTKLSETRGPRARMSLTLPGDRIQLGYMAQRLCQPGVRPVPATAACAEAPQRRSGCRSGRPDPADQSVRRRGPRRHRRAALPPAPRRRTARLVELDPEIAAVARSTAAEAGLRNVEVVTGDAALVSAYAGLAPADIVLACGIFGNVDDADIRRTIDGLPQLSRPGATVLWTRTRRDPDLTPSIRTWFQEAGFDEIGFDYEQDSLFSVGAQRFRGETPSLDPTAKLFEFLPR